MPIVDGSITPGLSPDMNPAAPAVAPVVPIVDAIPAPEPKPEGLDKFAFLTDNDKDKKGSKDTPPEPEAPFDPVALLSNEEATTALLSKIDFSKSISEDTQKLIAAGDPSALLALSNDIGKQAYLMAAQHSVAINKRYVDEQLANQSTAVQSKINSTIDDTELARLIPEIKNPILGEAVNGFVAKYRAQNPTASADDVAKQVKSYLGELNSTVNKPEPESKPEDEGINWLKDLGIDT
jgi:hypothetical protein